MALTSADGVFGTRKASRFGRAGMTAALMLIDLNRFKDISDTLGHVRGDELLPHVAVALQAVCPPDTAYRLGGDEFVVFLGTMDGMPAVARAALWRFCSQRSEVFSEHVGDLDAHRVGVRPAPVRVGAVGHQ
jgi:diguanylate cyclase (GGDEF)-like protein